MVATADAGADLVGVVTLPEPVDPERSGQCSFVEVAASFGAELIESADINAPETVAAIAALEPELLFVIGWSQILREPVLALAPGGAFGMHPTLLPRHRGRAPIPWAILSGLAATGVTLFEIPDARADSGSIVGQIEVAIASDETATTLFERLADAHVELIRTFVPAILDGTAPRLAQDERRASSWPKRAPADGIIDWQTRAPYLYDWVRAQTRPYPGAFTYLGDSKVVVWSARPVDGVLAAVPGTVVERRSEGPVVACGGGGALLLDEVEAPESLPVGALLG
ncbi:MAG: formyltransferase family protein [Gaiellaceae bacterium]